MSQMTHRERVIAAFKGSETDRTPISMWRHFGGIDMSSQGLADAMVGFQDEFDWDFIKFMPTGTYSIMDWGAETLWNPNLRGIRDVVSYPIHSAKDWANLPVLDTSKGVFGMVNAALADTVKRVGKNIPVLQTIFSPLSTARKLAGDTRSFADMRTDAQLFESGLEIITSVTERLIADAVDRGADIFYVMQSGTADMLGADEFERYELTYARRLLATVPAGSLTVLHSHGDNLWFEPLLDLPVGGINWHDQTAYPSLAEARGASNMALLGGIDAATLFREGTCESVERFITNVAATVDRGLILTPGCVLRSDSSTHLMRVARRAVGA